MRTTLVALTLVAIPGFAVAQERGGAPVSRLEIGGQMSALLGYTVAGGPKFTFNFNRRHPVQTTFDFRFDGYDGSRSLNSIYTVEYRYTLPLHSQDTRVFITAGASAFWNGATMRGDGIARETAVDRPTLTACG